MSSAIPRLVYFNIEGAAEKVRLAFKLTGINFVDERVSFADWSTMKATMPNGQLPVMYTNDDVFCQSSAMTRWVAKHGDGSLYPVGNMSLCFKIDELVGLAEDEARDWRNAVMINMRPIELGHPDGFQSTEEGKAVIKSMRETYMRDTLPKYMAQLKNALAKNGGPFLTGSIPTLADIWWLPRMRNLVSGIVDHVPKDCLDVYPEVLTWRDAMMSIPEIAAHYTK
jgi:glutathione S-transferase